MLDSSDELYKWFTQKVMINLHVVFTMNPSENGLKDRAATSPALFNRTFNLILDQILFQMVLIFNSCFFFFLFFVSIIFNNEIRLRIELVR